MNHPLTVWVGMIITLTVMSCLIRDNIFYRLAQKMAMGVSVGIAVVVTWQQVLQPYWWTPIKGSFVGSLVVTGTPLVPITPATTLSSAGISPLPLTSIELDYGGSQYAIDLSSATDVGDVLDAVNNSKANVTARINGEGNAIEIVAPRPGIGLPARLAVKETPDGSTAARLGILSSASLTPRTGALWLLALIPGIMWYCQMSKKWFYLSRPVIGLFIGVAAGLAFKGQVLLILPQIGAALRPLNPWSGAQGLTQASFLTSLNNLVFMIAFFTTLFYFCFTIKATNRIFRIPMKTGRLIIMVALGAMFGNTVMTRMSFLIERMQFLADFLIKPLFR